LIKALPKNFSSIFTPTFLGEDSLRYSTGLLTCYDIKKFKFLKQYTLKLANLNMVKATGMRALGVAVFKDF